MTVTAGPVRVSGYDLTDRDVFPPHVARRERAMNLECPRCGSEDVDLAPHGSKHLWECQECGKKFTPRDDD